MMYLPSCQDISARRLKRVVVDAATLIKHWADMDGTQRIKCEGIPKTAKVVGMFPSGDPSYPHKVDVIIEDESFPEVAHGQYIPEMLPTFTHFLGCSD